MSFSSLIKEPLDKFKVDETAPFFEIGPTGSYGSIESGLKNEYVLKFKDNETKNVIKKSGIIGSNSTKNAKPPITKTILTFSDNQVGQFFEWSETYWTMDFSFQPNISYTNYIEDITRLGGIFPYPDKLISVQVGNTITAIAKDAFKNCINLSSVSIPYSVRSIGIEAFRGCISLVSITLPYSVNSIGIRSFADCESLTDVTLPTSGTTIEYRAFAGCTSLKIIKIAATVFYIGDEVFVDSDLETVIIPYHNAAYVKSPDLNVNFRGKAGVNVIPPIDS